MAELSYVATPMAGSPDIGQPRQGFGILVTLFRLIQRRGTGATWRVSQRALSEVRQERSPHGSVHWPTVDELTIRGLNWGSNRGSSPAGYQRFTVNKPHCDAEFLNSATDVSDLQWTATEVRRHNS